MNRVDSSYHLPVTSGICRLLPFSLCILKQLRGFAFASGFGILFSSGPFLLCLSAGFSVLFRFCSCNSPLTPDLTMRGIKRISPFHYLEIEIGFLTEAHTHDGGSPLTNQILIDSAKVGDL